MSTTFTGIKDVDLKILSELDDRSLLNVCATNKYVYNTCKDEYFWRNRFVNKYGIEAGDRKPNERSWKNHYMQVIIDLSLFAKNPMDFLKHIVWGGSIEKSYFEPETDRYKTYQYYVPLFRAPEWVITNLYLLNLGKEIKLAHSRFYDSRIFFNPTPIKLLTFLSTSGYVQFRGLDLLSNEGYKPLQTRYIPIEIPSQNRI